jgi:hypothetical protein
LILRFLVQAAKHQYLNTPAWFCFSVAMRNLTVLNKFQREIFSEAEDVLSWSFK